MTTISKLRDFLKFLGSVKGDLANITAPPYFLAPASNPIRSCAPFSCSNGSSPASNTSSTPGRSIKKPLNAFLGEIFRAQWTDGRATANLVSEQISHHPPITAVYMWDEEHGIRGEGYSRVEMLFVNVLMGKAAQTTGTVYVNGEASQISRFKKLISHVPQDDVLMAECTVRENIDYAASMGFELSEKSNVADAVLDIISGHGSATTPGAKGTTPTLDNLLDH
ncbi:hypothetical protein F5144DRAFT_637998 [Chaetomium tenue]|uniref:Uncharacterized protein n=1 Tax=Chaetomium tenue TaxID=1854479 RepID=A0ACB7PSC7_9PEZI|nr:hypothetical protein F5144DRAFT_637998 [Chaetomium globosum]